MTFAPIAPTIHFAPTKIADDTFVIHQVQPALGQPLSVYINSMVILGEQPVIVDTGTPANREQWLRRRVRARRARRRALDLPVARRRRPHRQPRPGADRVHERPARVQLGDGRAPHQLLRLPDRPLPVDASTATPSTSATARCTRSARRCSTPRPPAASTTRRPASTGRSTRSPRRCPIPRWASPTSTRGSGPTRCGCSRYGAVSPWLTMVDPAKFGLHDRPGREPRHHDDRGLPHAGDRGTVHRARVRPHPQVPDARPAARSPTRRSSSRSSRRWRNGPTFRSAWRRSARTRRRSRRRRLTYDRPHRSRRRWSCSMISVSLPTSAAPDSSASSGDTPNPGAIALASLMRSSVTLQMKKRIWISMSSMRAPAASRIQPILRSVCSCSESVAASRPISPARAGSG